MSDIQFVNGLRLEAKETQYGELLTGSIDVEKILNNPINNGKWVNFIIKRGKDSNKPYAVINTYKKEG